jgi:hypothetical protein
MRETILNLSYVLGVAFVIAVLGNINLEGFGPLAFLLGIAFAVVVIMALSK